MTICLYDVPAAPSRRLVEGPGCPSWRRRRCPSRWSHRWSCRSPPCGVAASPPPPAWCVARSCRETRRSWGWGWRMWNILVMHSYHRMNVQSGTRLKSNCWATNSKVKVTSVIAKCQRMHLHTWPLRIPCTSRPCISRSRCRGPPSWVRARQTWRGCSRRGPCKVTSIT